MEPNSDCHIRQGLQSKSGVFRLADDSTKLMQHQIHNAQHVHVCVCGGMRGSTPSYRHASMHMYIYVHAYRPRTFRDRILQYVIITNAIGPCKVTSLLHIALTLKINKCQTDVSCGLWPLSFSACAWACKAPTETMPNEPHEP